MNDMHRDAGIAHDNVERMRKALYRIQELATDTPTKRDMEKALNAIVRECEDTLSA